MRVDRTEYTSFVLQEYLAVNPRFPQWADVSEWAVPGYWQWKDHPNRISRVGEKYWGDVLAFDDREVALSALWHAKIAPLHPHPYGRDFGNKKTGLMDRGKYRIVERSVLITQREVADESSMCA